MIEPKVEIITHSVGPTNIELVTYLLEYPRFIHGELMTHRVFSRNAASSRAIPFKTMTKRIQEDGVEIIDYQKRHRGMQGSEVFTGWRREVCELVWEDAKNSAIECAERLDRIGVTKQIANRISEPFSTIKVLVTATEWNNFFMLRDHPDAEIHIQLLARKMKEALDGSTPTRLKQGEWHLPFITEEDIMEHRVHDQTYRVDWDGLLQVSAARSARTSYLNNYGKKDYNSDYKLYEQLITNEPQHASPIEHQAQAISEEFSPENMRAYPCDFLEKLSIPDGCELRMKTYKDKEIWSGNFRGWKQNRKVLEK